MSASGPPAMKLPASKHRLPVRSVGPLHEIGIPPHLSLPPVNVPH